MSGQLSYYDNLVNETIITVSDSSVTIIHNNPSNEHTYHAAGMSRRQVQNVPKISNISTFWNFMTIFGIAMRNAFK